MTIPLDTYFTIDPAAEFRTKSHGVLFNQELFFYVSETGELRVRNFNGNVAYTIAQNVQWAAAFEAPDRVHLYYSVGGAILYIPYFHFGTGTLTTIDTGISNSVTFDAHFLTQSTPQVFTLIVDDGIRHTLYVANDPQFQSLVAQPLVVFTNTIDPAHYVTRPRFAMHPMNTNILTIHCQRILVSDSTSSTGFYAVRVPGVS